jgi:predicted RNase H-like nuclease (RuvC/YqgF family)
MGHKVLGQSPYLYRPSVGRRSPLATIREISKWNKLRQAVKRQTNRKRVAKVGEVRGRFTVMAKSPNSPKVGNRRGRFTLVARPPSLVNMYRKIEANILNLEDQVTTMRRRLRKNLNLNKLENKIYNHQQTINAQVKPLENKLAAAYKEAANLKKKINSARP